MLSQIRGPHPYTGGKFTVLLVTILYRAQISCDGRVLLTGRTEPKAATQAFSLPGTRRDSGMPVIQWTVPLDLGASRRVRRGYGPLGDARGGA
jgi:hypothetical protein